MAFPAALRRGVPAFCGASPLRLARGTAPVALSPLARGARRAAASPLARGRAPGASSLRRARACAAAVGEAEAPAAPDGGAAPRLYDTLRRAKAGFAPGDADAVRFYACGPTVYDFAHVGNFRAFLTYDVVVRWLRARGYGVRHVMNLTDVDDKIIVRAREAGVGTGELTERFADAFFKDLGVLNVVTAERYPRATEFIREMEDVVCELMRKGHAYEAGGSVYFSVASFPRYGGLAERGMDEAGGEPGEKRDARDFALWKAWKPDDGDVYWDGALGKGRPGWHIECTSMALSILGAELDIHGGGVDLAFPHHENERAQSEALTGRTYARFWLHNGFVNVDNEKMSKSLGNFRTLRDVVRRPDDARAFRYLVVSAHYRSALAFTPECMQAARGALRRLDALRARLDAARAADDAGVEEVRAAAARARTDFATAMDDDLSTPRATAAMFAFVGVCEKRLKAHGLGGAAAHHALACMDYFDQVYGVHYEPQLVDEHGRSVFEEAAKEVRLTPELSALLDERAEARAGKDWARADTIRDTLAQRGLCVVDTKDGPQLKPV